MHSARESWFLLLSIPFYSILIGMEIFLSNWTGKRFYSVKETLQNVYLSLVNAGLDLFLRGLFYISILLWFYNHSLFTIHNVYLYWFLLFLFEDLAFYIEHRVEHFSRFFWAVHVTHHSSEEFNLTTGFRSSVFQPVYRFIFLSPLAWMGFHPLDIVFMYSLTQTYGILVHTQFIHKMPAWFESVFVSPSHHRVHHASNIPYLDKNMGMCLIIWDKMFGTFQKELPREPVRYGLTSPIENRGNPIQIIFHEWKSILADLKRPLPLITKIKYVFRAPGWSHDGSRKTSGELQKEFRKSHNPTQINPSLEHLPG